MEKFVSIHVGSAVQLFPLQSAPAPFLALSLSLFCFFLLLYREGGGEEGKEIETEREREKKMSLLVYPAKESYVWVKDGLVLGGEVTRYSLFD